MTNPELSRFIRIMELVEHRLNDIQDQLAGLQRRVNVITEQLNEQHPRYRPLSGGAGAAPGRSSGPNFDFEGNPYDLEHVARTERVLQKWRRG